MKKLKRVFLFILCFISIFCILLVNVFAASPEFPLPQPLANKSLYSPCSNLESILVRGDGGGSSIASYYSLSSPYSLYEDSIRFLHEYQLPGYTLTNSYPIGTYRFPGTSVVQNFSVESNLIYAYNFSGWSDAPANFSVDQLSLLGLQNYEFLDFQLTYSNSAIPYAVEESTFINYDAYDHPFWPRYEFNLSCFEDPSNITDVPPLRLTFSGGIMSFEYSYFNRGAFGFDISPYYHDVSLTLFYDLTIDQDASLENGYTIFEPIFIDLYDIAVDFSKQLMVDNTSNSSSVLNSYCVFDELNLHFEWYPDSSLMPFVENVFIFEYFLDPYYFNFLKCPPTVSGVLEFFSENYPVYELPQSFDDLDFTDFLSSVMSIFSIPLIGEFTLAHLLFGVAGIGLLMWFLKMFAGG